MKVQLCVLILMVMELPNGFSVVLGDLVDDISLSDDGKVAVAVTWGDLAHTKTGYDGI